jgi:hypothetical protein
MLAPCAPCLTAAVARRGDRPYALDLGPTLYYEPWPGRYTLVGGNVSVMKDWVGTNDASQGTSSARPALVARYARNYNALSWDGGDRLAMAAAAMSGTGPVTLMAVHKGDDTGVNRSIFHPCSTGGIGLAFYSTGARIERLNGIGDVVDGAATTSLEAWCGRRSTTTLRLHINGSAQALDAPAATPAAPSGAGTFGSLSGTAWPALGKTIMIAIFDGKEITDAHALGWWYDVQHRYGV